MPRDVLIKVVDVRGPQTLQVTVAVDSTAVELPPSVLMWVGMIAVHPSEDIVFGALKGELLVEVIDVRRPVAYGLIDKRVFALKAPHTVFIDVVMLTEIR